MNMLCGIIEQTSGEILIFNYDTRYHMEYLRQFISYCPQRMFFI
jgi:ABC-type multidrug transport system ATPase subunit